MTSREGWIARAQGLLDELRSTLVSFEISIAPDLRIEADTHPCPGYVHDDRTIRFCPPVIEGVADRLRWAFFRGYMGCSSQEEAADFYALALPLVIAHEVAHHVRITEDMASSSAFEEEQICDRIAVALVESGSHRGTLGPLREACTAMRARLDLRFAEGPGRGFVPDEAEALVTTDHLDRHALVLLEQAAERGDIPIDQLIRMSRTIDPGRLRKAHETRERARVHLEAHYTQDPAAYWHLSLRWIESYLSRHHRTGLLETLNKHLSRDRSRSLEVVSMLQDAMLTDADPRIREAAASGLLETLGGEVAHDLADLCEAHDDELIRPLVLALEKAWRDDATWPPRGASRVVHEVLPRAIEARDHELIRATLRLLGKSRATITSALFACLDQLDGLDPLDELRRPNVPGSFEAGHRANELASSGAYARADRFAARLRTNAKEAVDAADIGAPQVHDTHDLLEALRDWRLGVPDGIVRARLRDRSELGRRESHRWLEAAASRDPGPIPWPTADAERIAPALIDLASAELRTGEGLDARVLHAALALVSSQGARGLARSAGRRGSASYEAVLSALLAVMSEPEARDQGDGVRVGPRAQGGWEDSFGLDGTMLPTFVRLRIVALRMDLEPGALARARVVRIAREQTRETRALLGLQMRLAQSDHPAAAIGLDAVSRALHQRAFEIVCAIAPAEHRAAMARLCAVYGHGVLSEAVRSVLRGAIEASTEDEEALANDVLEMLDPCEILEARHAAEDASNASRATASIPPSASQERPSEVLTLVPSVLLDDVALGSSSLRIGARCYDATGMRTLVERLVHLRAVPLFEQVSPDALLTLATLTVEQSFHEGDVIFREGEPGDQLHVILAGRVRLEQRGGSEDNQSNEKNGNQEGSPTGEGGREIATLGTPSCFGEMALFDGEPRSATAIAATRVWLLTLDGEAVRRAGRRTPELYEALLRVMAGRLRGQRLK